MVRVKEVTDFFFMFVWRKYFMVVMGVKVKNDFSAFLVTITENDFGQKIPYSHGLFVSASTGIKL